MEDLELEWKLLEDLPPRVDGGPKSASLVRFYLSVMGYINILLAF